MTQPLWFLGIHFNIIADATTTGGKYDLLEGYFPSGIQTPPHRHTRYSEQVYVLEGEVTVWAGADKHVLHPGESFLISIGTPHVVGSVSDKPARLLVVASPSSFARLIEATGTLDETAPQDMALLDRISTEIGDEILGAPGELPRQEAMSDRR
jgi:mannose-6-phosphate isomerase-like protein (cupin superfamily)